MKKYTSLGELLMGFRGFKKISQIDLASMFEVDIRTIIRWEKNQTLLKPEKEKEIAEISFIPHQVIRNLNTTTPIHTFYDFEIRKYSLSPLSTELPDPEWIKKRIDDLDHRIRPIETDDDINSIIRNTLLQRDPLKTINKQLFKEAIRFFPELNLIVTDELGNYAGHCLYLTLDYNSYNKIKNQEIMENEISISDLVNYKNQSQPVFYCHSITADCNENFFYIIGAVLKFFRDTSLKENYIYALITDRYDSYDMSKDLGISLIWEDKQQQQKLDLKAPPRLYEGNFTEFLK